MSLSIQLHFYISVALHGYFTSPEINWPLYVAIPTLPLPLRKHCKETGLLWCVSFFTYHRPVPNATRNIGYCTIYTRRYRNICIGSSPYRHEPRNTRTPRSNPLRSPTPQRLHVPTRNAPQSCCYALPSQHEANPGPPWITIQLTPNHTYIARYNNHSNFPWVFPKNLSE